MCAYRMGDAGYRADQHARIREPHVAPINKLVDSLADPAGRGTAPYVAPINGGTEARILSLMASPGKSTEPGESQMLSIENEDNAARRLGELLSESHIPVAELLPWNAYPWNGRDGADLSVGDLDAGIEPLRALLQRSPRIGIVMLHGRKPQQFWKRFVRQHPARARSLRVIDTWSTADRVFIGPRRDEYWADLQKAMGTAAALLRAVDVPG